MTPGLPWREDQTSEWSSNTSRLSGSVRISNDNCPGLILHSINHAKSGFTSREEKCRCYLFLKINLFFIGVQFANISNNTQCSSHQVSTSVPVTQSPQPPPSSPSTTPSSFPRVRSLSCSLFLIFPTHFFSFPLYSLSLFFIFPNE